MLEGFLMRMTAGLRICVAGALAVFGVVCGLAADLKTYKDIYEKNTEEIRGGFQPKFDGLQQQYRKSLEALKASTQSQGDLIKTKAAMAEIDRFQKAKSLPASLDENEIPDIKAIQSAYVTQYNRLEIDMTAQLGLLTSKFEEALERFEKELTKAGKIDAATQTHGEREKAQATIKSYTETLDTLKGPAATNATFVQSFSKPTIATERMGAKKDLYMVVDLARGTKAKDYPVSYLADVPKGGWKDEYKADKLVLRKIEPGTFTMGSPEDEVGRSGNEKQHEVTLTKAFYIGVFEVTQKQWERVMGNWPSQFSNVKYRDERPVDTVSYNDIRGKDDGANWPTANSVDALSFLGKLRARTGKAFDLPTEAQWEYACRAGAVTALNSGKNLTEKESCPNLTELARYKANSGNGGQNADTSVGTAKVGSYLPNAWGLYNMHGNVWEWCLDKIGNDSGTTSDPKGAASGLLRVGRGGGWARSANECRSAYRSSYTPGNAFSDIGLRVSVP
jgi:formylglycine-generating enzyme required for sulfatase activity